MWILDMLEDLEEEVLLWKKVVRGRCYVLDSDSDE